MCGVWGEEGESAVLCFDICDLCRRWMQLVGVYSSFVISVSIGTYIVAVRTDESPEKVALVLTYSFFLPYFLTSLAQTVTNVRVWFTSLERVREFEYLPQEPSHELTSDGMLNDWPRAGRVQLKDVSLRYAPDKPLVIKGDRRVCDAGVRCGLK